MENFKTVFESARNKNWKINQVKYEYNFELACELLIPIRKRFDLTMNDYELAQNQYKCWLKNTMGYRGIGSSGINSGLCSKNALELKYKFGKDYKYDVSDDHVLGATLIGETVEKAIEMSNWNPKLLIKEGWLHDNLHLWGMVRVTKEEHHKDNIVRNKHNLNEKLNFEHYKSIGIEDLVRITDPNPNPKPRLNWTKKELQEFIDA